MADEIKLNATARSAVRHGVKALRRSGKVPAVVYGKGVQPLAIQLDGHEVINVLRHSGRNRLITLNLGDAAAPRMVLTREIQRDAIKRTVQHIDFYEVSMTEKVNAQVRIVPIGESADIKSGAGVLLQELDAIDIRCLPMDLIEKIEIDVSGLLIDGVIRVRDLTIPAGIEVMDELEDEVVRVTRFVEVKEEEAPVVEAPEVEVIEKGKKEEEEGAEGAEAPKK
jgi:large subunit ribosomal protein L25